MRVGFIGLGSQGAPMARRIVDGGYDLTLWARRPATLEPFADTAAKTAGFTGRPGGRQRSGLRLRHRRRRRQGSTGRRKRRAGRTVDGRDRGDPQHSASRHMPGASRIRCYAGCFGHRRAGERRRPRRRGGHVARHGRRRRRDRRALPPGLRHLRRSDRASRTRSAAARSPRFSTTCCSPPTSAARSTPWYSANPSVSTANGCARCSTAGRRPARRSAASPPSAARSTNSLRSPGRCCRRTSGTPPASPTPHRHRRERYSTQRTRR